MVSVEVDRCVLFEDQEVMPFDSDSLVSSVASALEAACVDELPHKCCTVPRMFFGEKRQKFGMDLYVKRLVELLQCSDSAFVTAIIYLDRLQMLNPANGITHLNVHRLFATALLLAVKYHDDEHYSNTYYAEAFGMRSLEEVNRLEVELLKLLDYRLNVDEKDYNMYKQRLQFFYMYVHGESKMASYVISAA